MNAAQRTDVVMPEPPASNTMSLMEVVARAAADPNTDADKMERLLGMYERITAQQAKAAFTVALATMQPKLPVIDEKGGISNNSGTVQSTYAKWEDINEAIQPVLHEHGFALNFRPGVAPDGKQTVTAILRHVEGFEEAATVTIPYDSSGNKNSVQAVGSSLSYGKRYAAIAVLNITSRAKEDRDDDGRSAGFGEATQKAIADINMVESLEDLRAWKSKNYDGFSKLAEPHELREVIALYNRRSKAFRASEKGNG